jgi:hypothetical protein
MRLGALDILVLAFEEEFMALYPGCRQNDFLFDSPDSNSCCRDTFMAGLEQTISINKL